MTSFKWGYARILCVIWDLRKGCGFIFPVCFLYCLSRFPIHECIYFVYCILIIVYLLQGSVMEQPCKVHFHNQGNLGSLYSFKLNYYKH
jgi:phosphoglycerol transferase MdoB-like AlkP superfamily enzyme